MCREGTLGRKEQSLLLHQSQWIQCKMCLRLYMGRRWSMKWKGYSQWHLFFNLTLMRGEYDTLLTCGIQTNSGMDASWSRTSSNPLGHADSSSSSFQQPINNEYGIRMSQVCSSSSLESSLYVKRQHCVLEQCSTA